MDNEEFSSVYDNDGGDVPSEAISEEVSSLAPPEPSDDHSTDSVLDESSDSYIEVESNELYSSSVLETDSNDSGSAFTLVDSSADDSSFDYVRGIYENTSFILMFLLVFLAIFICWIIRRFISSIINP